MRITPKARIEVISHLTERFEPHWIFDLFQNVITAAVDD
jgi:hypothetical protein